ncbi:hypothetical protein ACFPIJ_59175 [Dactylosporangium cerinum]|uniref:Uncharacterized protein n=1 Tax=Dactylosporangium cerinum TaxID=1434730 RepID=A0ABV9WJB2_9ACTN
MSRAFTAELGNTVVGRWFHGLADNPSIKRNHWHTKSVYFRSVARLVEHRPGEPLSWRSIVDAAEPRGCRSTFYEVTGAHARHRMIGALIKDGRNHSIQLALRYQRRDAVSQLLDEAKVWSFWQHRERVLRRFAETAPVSAQAAEDAIVRELLTWVARNPKLAATLDHTPPACVVEDLMVVHEGNVVASRVASHLTDLIRDAVTAR